MRFSLLTYNIHKAIGVDRVFSPARIVEILRHHNADIVLLQEVDRGAPRLNHLDLASYLARELDYSYRAVGMNVFLKKGKYGNATLSRFPISHERNFDLTIGWRKRRGAQHTRIFLPAGDSAVELDVFNVHLGLSATERTKQLARLLEAPDLKTTAPHRPVIVAGDMNDWRNLLLNTGLRSAGFACATNRHAGSRWSIKTFPSYAPAGGLDKVFYRGPVKLLDAHRSQHLLTRVASDHLPIVTHFELSLGAREEIAFDGIDL